MVSRGGAAPWYRHISPHYHDILSLYGADEFRARNEARVHEQKGRLKHIDLGEFDRDIVERVQKARRLGKVKVLHPSLMYTLFNVFWRQQAPITLIEAFSVFRAFPKLPLGDLAAHLPRDYVAVKFYANSALPDTAGNRALIAQALTALTRTTDVVLLNTGQRYDDHSDFAPGRRERLHHVEHLMTPETNLEVQTRIISGARAFVGTYGGFSYLAPFHGTEHGGVLLAPDGIPLRSSRDRQARLLQPQHRVVRAARRQGSRRGAAQRRRARRRAARGGPALDQSPMCCTNGSRLPI